ncbi:MAG: uroporphyrinogen-III synthase [Acidobacteriota bacterium]|nr:uroporphyrinogen-III synthase [Acidobacteriota bacterium]
MNKKAVLVIREFGDFSETLIANGFEVINFPTIATSKIEDLSGLEKNIANIEKYDGIFFSSPKAAAVFLEKFDKKYRGKIYILGNRLKTLFENKGFEIVYRESVNTAEEFINSFDKSEFVAKQFLFLKGDKSLRVIPEMLKEIAEIEETVIYKTIDFEIEKEFINKINQKFSRHEINFICFFSPSGVESFLNVFGGFEQNKIKIAAVGKTTAERIKESGLEANFIAQNAKDFAFEFYSFFR